MYAVLDTNILLLDANNLLTIGESSIVVLPETVLDEIDNKKSGHSEIAFQARAFGRLLAKATSTGTEYQGNLVITSFQLDSTIIQVVALKDYPNYSDIEPAILNDRKIIEVAHQYQLAGNLPLVFMSNDVMCRIRASSIGLSVTDLKEVQDTDIVFTIQAQLDNDNFSTLDYKDITAIYPNHKPEVFSYKFECDGHTKLTTVRPDGRLNVIGKTEERQLREQPVMPTNSDQLIMSSLIQDQTVDLTIVEALAGSGKTMMAMSNAMKLVSINSPYDNIVYIRNTVDDVAESDEEIGFLSGNDEKLAIYLHPFYDTLASIARIELKGKFKPKDLEDKVQERVDSYIAKYAMHPMVALGLRGRTFDNSVIIIDEAQNMSKATMQKVLSRVGKNCKVVVIGSTAQIDSKYLTKYTSGLTVLLEATKYNDWPISINAIKLHKVVRGPVTEFAEKLFTKK